MTLHATTTTRPVIDLNLEIGNVFKLLGLVGTYGKTLGWSAVKIADVKEEMMSDDYPNAVRVFERELGQYVDIIVPEGLENELMGDCSR